MASVEVALDPKQLSRLDEASRIELGFPHDFYAKDMVVIICETGIALITEKGNTVAQPQRATCWSPRGVEDAHGGRLCSNPAGPA